MKNIIYKWHRNFSFLILLSLLSSLPVSLAAQTPAEKLGGLETNYIISSDSMKLPIQAQLLIRRGYMESEHSEYTDASFGYGYGLQIFTLEFVSAEKIASKEVPIYERNKPKKVITVKLYDKDKDIILSCTLPPNVLSFKSNGMDLYTYSLRLEKIPMVLLLRARFIDISPVTRNYVFKY